MRFSFYLVAITFFLYGSSLTAQEQIGLRLDKYSGVNSLSINPANGANFALNWDFNLVGAGVFLENNFVFAQPTNLIHLAQNSDKLFVVDPSSESPVPSNAEIFVDYNTDASKRMAQINTTILGPSFMLNLDGKHSLGFITGFNVAIGGFGIDNDLDPYYFIDLDENSKLDIESFQMSGMAWANYGLHYSYGVENYLGKFSFGANLKLLRGYEAFYLDVAKPISAEKVGTDDLNISEIDVSFGFTNRSIETQTAPTKAIGSGYGIDLGATWLFDVDEDQDYRFKLGVSVIDFGKINFDKWTENYRVTSDGTATNLDASGFSSVTSKEEAFEELSNQLFGTPDNIRQPAGIGMWTPAALSIQADFQITKGVFVAGLLNQRLSFSPQSIKRNNTLAIYPRVENRWFSLGFPVVINNWQDFRLGTSARIGFLTVGSDNLGSLVGRSTLTGTDFYFALKFNPFQINLFKGGGGRSKGKPIKCYKF